MLLKKSRILKRHRYIRKRFTYTKNRIACEDCKYAVDIRRFIKCIFQSLCMRYTTEINKENNNFYQYQPE